MWLLLVRDDHPFCLPCKSSHYRNCFTDVGGDTAFPSGCPDGLRHICEAAIFLLGW